MKIKFVGIAVLWRDKVNGNTYHSVQIHDCETGKVYYCPFEYGYGDQYRHTALKAMVEFHLLPEKYNSNNCYLYEMENDYPISWVCNHSTKRDCVENGKNPN